MNTMTLVCPECEKANLISTVTGVTGTAQGESFTVNSGALVCPNCDFKTIPAALMGEFGLRISDAYRAAHNLLTSKQIKQRRLALKMSQKEFAHYLSVGVASVKRWELGQIQDEALNALMVLKTDIQAARQNATKVSSLLGERRHVPQELHPH